MSFMKLSKWAHKNWKCLSSPKAEEKEVTVNPSALWNFLTSLRTPRVPRMNLTFWNTDAMKAPVKYWYRSPFFNYSLSISSPVLPRSVCAYHALGVHPGIAASSPAHSCRWITPHSRLYWTVELVSLIKNPVELRQVSDVSDIEAFQWTTENKFLHSFSLQFSIQKISHDIKIKSKFPSYQNTCLEH